MTARLYVFTVSHYAEKARWALDCKRIPYELKVLLPGPHMFTMRRLSTNTEVPLFQDSDKIVQGSSRIIDYADERSPDAPLTPIDPALRGEAAELETRLDRDIGEVLRRIFYSYALDRPDFLLQLFTQAGPWWGRLFYRIGYRRVATAIRGMYGISRERAVDDKRSSIVTVRALEKQLGGRPYLFEGRFTRADLTAAALLAHVWRPTEHPVTWPTNYPDEFESWRAELEDSPVRDYVLRLYRDHRRTPNAARPVDATSSGTLRPSDHGRGEQNRW